MIDETTAFSVLSGQVDALGRSKSKAIRRAAQTAKKSLASLDPEPLTAYEAFGRLALASKSGASPPLLDLQNSTSSACGFAPLTFGDQTAASSLRPARAADGHVDVDGTFFGLSCASWQVLPPFRVVYLCPDVVATTTPTPSSSAVPSSSSPTAAPTATTVPRRQVTSAAGTVVVVDLDTGEVNRVPGVPSTFRVSGDYVSWISETTEPALGLEPTKFSASLQIAPLNGGSVVMVPLIKDSTLSSVSLDRRAIVAATPTRVVVETPDETGKVVSMRVFDTAGREIGRIDPATSGLYRDQFTGSSAQFVTTSSILLSGPQKNVLLDFDDAQLIDLNNRSLVQVGDATGCGDRRLLSLNDAVLNGSGFVVVDENSGRVTTTVGQNPQISGDFVVRPDVVVEGGYQNVRGVKPDGSQLWSLGSDVVSKWTVAGGWPYVTNRSGVQIIVDPRTGKEKTDASESLRSALSLMAGRSRLGGNPTVAYDAGSNSMVILVDGQAWHFGASEVCPR